MSDEPARYILVCQEVVGAIQPPMPSKKFFCVECGLRVWVSQPMIPKVMKGEMRPVCNPCGARLTDTDDDVTWGLLPEQEPQLEAFGILELSRAVVEAMQKRQDKR